MVARMGYCSRIGQNDFWVMVGVWRKLEMLGNTQSRRDNILISVAITNEPVEKFLHLTDAEVKCGHYFTNL